MPRLSRVFIDQACYHIITRGNQKQLIFRGENDYLKYISIVGRAKKKYGISLYAYCFMPNHIHLLIYSPLSRNISNFMHWVNRGYTAYFNTKYNKVGHLWQGRFVSKPIVNGIYLIYCATYIEANPVRASITKDIADYRWSSYKERCLAENFKIIDGMQIEDSEKVVGTALP